MQLTRMFAQHTPSVPERHQLYQILCTKCPAADLPQPFFPLLPSEDAAAEESENTEDSQKTQVLLQLETPVRNILLGGKSCHQQPENERLHLDREEMLQGGSQLGRNTWLGEAWL